MKKSRDNMCLMDEILAGKVTLEDAYCRAHNHVTALMEGSNPAEEERQITALLNTIDYIESALAEKYMSEKGYYCDNGAGVDIWRRNE